MIDHITLRDTARDSVLSKELGYGYVPISKAANTNVKRFLWQVEHELGHCRPVGEQYFSVHNYGWRFGRPDARTPWLGFRKSAIEEFYAALVGRRMLTVVRNPYIRLLSGYLEKIVAKVDVEPNIPAKFQLPRRPDNFADFVYMVCDRPSARTDIHFRSQTYASLFDFIAYDAVGHVETLAAGLADFSVAALGRDFSHLLSAKADHAMKARQKLKDHYTPDVARAIYARFRDDFLNFGYDYDLEAVTPVRPVARAGALNSYLEDAAHMCAPTLRDEDPAPSARAIAASETLLARLEAGQGISDLDKSLAPYARKLIQK
ncbi:MULTISPECIES: sulfotransferase family 2 domain-containing protein [Kordiimonas]|jgi:hypothetical protein|uniref:sulfotransferase family 2 domain-containing protein n=1 Tax=Kordiimonas TaxID=288021 RepID=UPI00257A4BF8|nr:sulfotransferase family 2 domain-containing protein [Kordiimonas sp. UBA4487]